MKIKRKAQLFIEKLGHKILSGTISTSVFVDLFFLLSMEQAIKSTCKALLAYYQVFLVIPPRGAKILINTTDCCIMLYTLFF
jgi:hypothetical protein